MASVAVRSGELPELLTEGPNSLSKTLAKFDPLEPLDHSKLNAERIQEWPSMDFEDEQLGIAVRVSAGGHTPESWSNSHSDVSGNPLKPGHGAEEKWLKLTMEAPEGSATAYIRKSPAAFKAAIMNPKTAQFVRFAALRDINDVRCSPEEQLTLFTSASADRDPSIRGLALLKAGSYQPIEKVISLLVRGLSDPSTEVAYGTIRPLAKFFDLRYPDDKQPFELPIALIGRADAMENEQRRRVAVVARSIQAIRPDLATLLQARKDGNDHNKPERREDEKP
ncbi:MAG: hypothetical protein NTW87_07520 [Planctomycetota bacterium]|nr:hypothetical protein [Planctomycetota bacterium]